MHAFRLASTTVHEELDRVNADGIGIEGL